MYTTMRSADSKIDEADEMTCFPVAACSRVAGRGGWDGRLHGASHADANRHDLSFISGVRLQQMNNRFAHAADRWLPVRRAPEEMSRHCQRVRQGPRTSRRCRLEAAEPPKGGRALSRPDSAGKTTRW